MRDADDLPVVLAREGSAIASALKKKCLRVERLRIAASEQDAERLRLRVARRVADVVAYGGEARERCGGDPADEFGAIHLKQTLLRGRGRALRA